MPKKHRERSREHDIDTLGGRLFQYMLPANVLADQPSQGQDYGTDYYHRFFIEGAETSTRLQVQLKSTGKSYANRKHVSVPIETHTLEKWADIEPHPVFLVVPSIPDKECYYVWMQQYLKGIDQKWRRQNSHRVRVPTSNRLSDSKTFVDIAIEADRYMMSPGTVIARERKRVRMVDPRFDVEFTSRKGENTFSFSAKTPVKCKLTFTGDRDSVDRQLADLNDHALPIEFPASEVKITGSPLFERSTGRGVMRLEPEPVSDATFTYALGTYSLPFHGKLFKGNKSVRFEGVSLGDCFQLVATFPRDQVNDRGRCTIKLTSRLAEFEGRNVQALPYLDQFCEIFGQDGMSGVSFSLDLCGNLLLGGTLTRADGFENVSTLATHLSVWRLAKRLGQRLGVAIPFTLHPPMGFARGIISWHRLVCGKDRSAYKLSVNSSMDAAELSRFLKDFSNRNSKSLSVCLEYGKHNHPEELNFTLPHCNLLITDVRTKPSVSQLKRRLKKLGSDEMIDVQFEGRKASEVHFAMGESP